MSICIDAGAYYGCIFGPVHEIADTRNTHGFISVRVPSVPLKDKPSVQLIWLNVHSCRKKGFTAFERISENIVSKWQANGWQDCWIRTQFSKTFSPYCNVAVEVLIPRVLIVNHGFLLHNCIRTDSEKWQSNTKCYQSNAKQLGVLNCFK